MSETDLAETTIRYSCMADLKVIRRRVASSKVRDFALALRRFERALADLRDDDYWTGCLRCMKTCRWVLCSRPVALNSEAAIPAETMATLRHTLNSGKAIFPRHVPYAEAVVSAIQVLVGSDENPLLDITVDLMRDRRHGRTALVLPSRVARDEVIRLAGARRELQDARVLVPSDLRAQQTFDAVVAFGAAQWYPEALFRAPPAPVIYIATYSWVPGGWSVGPLLCASSGAGGGSRVRRDVSVAEVGAYEPTEYDGGSALDIMPVHDFSLLLTRAPAERTTDSSHEEEVQARLFVLADSKAVLLDEATSTMVVDPFAETGAIVARISVRDVAPGMLLLLRTAGGGDYVADVANRILGHMAKQARDAQTLWKDRLRKEVQASDALQVALRLLDNGAEKANEVNVRNWCSYRSIKTQDHRDFRAIMKTIGLESVADEYWRLMTLIDSAHRSAGHYIRRRLLKQVKAVGPEALERDPVIEFELPDAAGGSMTALRVEQVAPTSYGVPYSRTGILFPSGE